MIKVLHTGLTENYGGTEATVYNYYKELDKKQFHVDILTTQHRIALEEQITNTGAKVHKISSPKKRPISSFIEFNKVLKENEYDVIHINLNSFANFIPLIAAKMCHVPKIILHSHNNGVTFSPLKVFLHNFNRLATEKMNVVRLACSDSAGKWMFKNAPFIVLENSINHEPYKFNPTIRQNLRKELGVADDEFLIGNVGRLCEQKNQAWLIKLFKLYQSINSKSKLIIIGDGDLKNNLKSTIEELDLQDKVIMTGFVSDPAPYYQAMDLFCLPSVFEGLGIVGIEAQISGLPCVCSTNCVDELKVTNNVDFINLNDSPLWLDIIESYRKADIDRNVTVEKYNIKNSVKKLEHIYTK